MTKTPTTEEKRLPHCVHNSNDLNTRTKYFRVKLTCGTILNGVYIDCERCHRSDIVGAIIDLIGDSFRQKFTGIQHTHIETCKLDVNTLKISSLPTITDEEEEEESDRKEVDGNSFICACRKCVTERLQRGKVTVCACPHCPKGTIGCVARDEEKCRRGRYRRHRRRPLLLHTKTKHQQRRHH